MTTERIRSETYNTNLSWKEERKGVAFLKGAAAIDVSTPAYEGFWTPGSLLLASVEACFMNYFVAYARRAGLIFAAYDSEAEGVAQQIEGRPYFAFTKVTVTPKILVKDQEDIDKAKRVIGEVEELCMIARSLACEVVVEPQVEVASS